MIDLSLTFHVWDIVLTLALVTFYAPAIGAGFRWLRDKTRKPKQVSN